MIRVVFALFYLLLAPFSLEGALRAGVGKREITPPIGTPSAGYAERKGVGMEGVRDPLLANALVIEGDKKKIALCSVDHLGFTHEMVAQIKARVPADCEVYVASSHTHSGGGAYLDLPLIGEMLAGPYDGAITDFYIQQTAAAINEAYTNTQPAKVGIGYSTTPSLSTYRSSWPEHVTPLDRLTLIKVVTLDEKPLAALFNYPVHPTTLKSENRLFSADFVGEVRTEIQRQLGEEVLPLYFNGAQGDLNPSCTEIAPQLAESVVALWNETPVYDTLTIETRHTPYAFTPQPTPHGLQLPIESYQTEINALILDEKHAFVTIPGELSCIYDARLKEYGRSLGYEHVSIFGLTNDAHGYIILPEAWCHKTNESALSFGGEEYGDLMEKRAQKLLYKTEKQRQ